MLPLEEQIINVNFPITGNIDQPGRKDSLNNFKIISVSQLERSFQFHIHIKYFILIIDVLVQ